MELDQDTDAAQAARVARMVKRDFLARRDVATAEQEWRGALSVLAGMAPREIERAVARAAGAGTGSERRRGRMGQ